MLATLTNALQDDGLCLVWLGLRSCSSDVATEKHSTDKTRDCCIECCSGDMAAYPAISLALLSPSGPATRPTVCSVTPWLPANCVVRAGSIIVDSQQSGPNLIAFSEITTPWCFDCHSFIYLSYNISTHNPCPSFYLIFFLNRIPKCFISSGFWGFGEIGRASCRER